MLPTELFALRPQIYYQFFEILRIESIRKLTVFACVADTLYISICLLKKKEN